MAQKVSSHLNGSNSGFEVSGTQSRLKVSTELVTAKMVGQVLPHRDSPREKGKFLKAVS